MRPSVPSRSDQQNRAQSAIVTSETILSGFVLQYLPQALEGQAAIAWRTSAKWNAAFLYMLEVDPLQRGGSHA